jgi:hypothetical protein
MTAINIQNLFKKDSILLLVRIFVPGILLIGITAVCHLIFKIPFSVYSRDPIQVLNGRPYVGFISSIGIIMWCITAGILFFSAILASRQKKPGEVVGFLYYAGFFTSFMLIDDVFLFHDMIFPDYFKINENFFYFGYGIILLIFIFKYWKFILKTDYVLLLLAFGLFVSSAGVDQFTEHIFDLPGEYIYEDGFKLLGISCWVSYFVRTAYSLLKPGAEN